VKNEKKNTITNVGHKVTHEVTSQKLSKKRDSEEYLEKIGEQSYNVFTQRFNLRSYQEEEKVF